MVSNRLEPGAVINSGEPSVPRIAATVMLLRGGAETLEVLLVRRNPAQKFMGGAWVFPGGAVDRAEGTGQDAIRAAALRELDEEAAVTLSGPADLVPFSRWITPEAIKTRFDTWFFLAPAPEGAEPRIDGSECVDLRWMTPRAAIAEGEADRMLIVFPTLKHLEQISGFASAEALLDHARSRTVEPVTPRVEGSGEQARVLLPGDPGY